MAKAVKTYNQWRLEKLSSPEQAARYLNAAKRDSKEALLDAVKNVIQANQVARVAREAGVARESVYRSFSAEGNPTFDTLDSVLAAVGIKITFEAEDSSSPANPFAGGSSPAPVNIGSSGIQGIGASHLLIGAGASIFPTFPLAGWDQSTTTARQLNYVNSMPQLVLNYDFILKAETANAALPIPAPLAAELQNAVLQP
jgi:probable addiction module antidote protein